MADFTRDDLHTILAFGLHVARVDNDFAALEKNVLRHYVEMIGMSEEERAALAAQPVRLSEGLAHLSGTEARTLLIKTLCAVAFSDGVPHENELDFIQRVNHQVGRPLELKPWEEWGAYEEEVLAALGRQD